MRVLLADCHVVIRSGLRALLQMHNNFQICGEASNGREAVDLAIQKKPDVVVIDIDLSDIDGIEATRQIRRGAPSTELLVFTAENNEDLMQEALRAGARGYLLKSEPDQQIIQAIEAVAQHQTFCSSPLSEKLLDSLALRIPGISDGVRLTNRERQILRLIAGGHGGKRIAQMLGIGLRTVDTHRAAAMRKLELHSIADMVRYAIREKLI
jgi:DNA-binding NarL/FixJ family response regulator